VGYNEAGSNKLYIDNSSTLTPLIYGEFDNDLVTINGDLGIGTITPTSVLEVSNGTSTNDIFHLMDNTTEVFTVLDGGNVGIGTTSPNEALEVNGDIQMTAGPNRYIKFPSTTQSLFIGEGSTGPYSIALNSHSTISFRTNNSVRMKVDSSGYVGIGESTPTHLLHVAGVARSTQANWATSSDERVKENIADMTGSLARLQQLRPVSFNYIDAYKQNNEALEGKRMGFIAQEVKEVMPEMVSTTTETFGDTTIDDFHVLDSSNLIPMLVQAVQEQQNQVDEQKQLIEEQQEMISALTERLTRLEKL